jgi:hypothetical protein
MSEQALEQELREYLSKESNLSREDKLQFLMLIFNKNFKTKKMAHIINFYDLASIVSDSKSCFMNLNLPLFLSSKRVDDTSLTTVAVIDAFIRYLNQHNLLNKEIMFDCRQK